METSVFTIKILKKYDVTMNFRCFLIRVTSKNAPTFLRRAFGACDQNTLFILD